MNGEETRLDVTSGGRFRREVAAFFAFGLVLSIASVLIPHPVALNASLFAADLLLVLLTIIGALKLPTPIYNRINFGYVGALFVFGSVWATGGADSPLQLLYVFSSTAAAAILPERKAYAVTGVNVLFSLVPLVLNFTAPLLRMEIVMVPVMYGLTYLFARLNAEARYQRRARYIMEAIGRIGDLSSNAELPTVLSSLADALRRVTESEYCIIYLVEPGGETLRPAAVDGLPGPPLNEARAIAEITVHMGEGITGLVAQTGEPEIVGDMEGDTRGVIVPNHPPTLMSSVFVPLKAAGQVVGVLRLSREGLNRYTRQDLQIAEVVGQQAAVAVQNSRLFDETRELYEKTRWVSVTDALTGLFNQRYLSERLPAEIDRATQYAGRVSLLMMDADTLKQVNDRYGHDRGDQLIRGIADVLREHIRIGDTAIRYAGDEFLVILPDATDEQARAVGERIRRAVLDLDIAEGIPTSISMGAATYPDHASSMEELVKYADAALYESKRTGRNRLTVYGRAM